MLIIPIQKGFSFTVLCMAVLLFAGPASAESYDALMEQGMEAMDAGKLQQAARAYAGAAKQKPGSPDALERLAKVYKTILVKKPKDRKIQNSYLKTVEQLKDTAELIKA